MADRTCSVDGCERRISTKGYCDTHHYRWKRYGDPLKRQYLYGDVEGRFWQKVDKNGPVLNADLGACWVWTGRNGAGPYGHLLVGKKLVAAYRFSYELLVGPIPDGLVIDHLCRNPPCVNPAHLQPVTQGENNRRGVGFAGLNVRKTHCPQGHPYDETNTYHPPTGGRQCKVCRSAANARWRHRCESESSPGVNQGA